MTDSHDKLPKLFWIQLALAAFIGVMYLTAPAEHGGEHDADSAEVKNKVEAVSKNLAPVGAVTTNKTKTMGATKTRSGEEVYTASCLACHAVGIANAPKPDDKAAWEPRVATGLDAMMKTAIDGKGAMPARGGNPAITDDEIKAAILYMTKKAGFDLSAAKKVESAPAAMATKTATALSAPAAPETMKVAAAPAPDNKKGEEVYRSACFACHEAGVAGSPKVGDKEAWVARLATGNDALYASAINGIGIMPPKGGNMGLSDDDVKAAVNYMTQKSM